MNQPRLKSSFIYLANAVNDLRGHSAVLAVVLAPLVLLASLCLLPDAFNLQYEVVHAFQPGLQSVNYQGESLYQAQTPYRTEPAPPVSAAPYPGWLTFGLHLVIGLITLGVNLLVLCALQRIHEGESLPTVVAEAMAVYRESLRLLPSFCWIILLQLLAVAVAVLLGVALLLAPTTLILWLFWPQYLAIVETLSRALVPLPAAPVFIWLYFTQYALVFDGRHSWAALLYSRDLVRGRFFKAALRIVVFLAVWSGYNAWALGTFVLASFLLGPVGVITGFLWVAMLAINLPAVAVGYATTAFFFAAGVRLYQDLRMLRSEQEVPAAVEEAPGPTGPLGTAIA